MASSSESSSYNMYAPKIELYDKGTLLGEGSNGAVYLWTNKVSKRKYACKVVTKSNLGTQRQQEKVKHEIGVMFKIKDIKCCNLITIHDVIEDQACWYILMELCQGGTLKTRLSKICKFREFEAAKIIKDIMIGISACHKRGIVHRDLKVNNVVFETNQIDSKVKIIDFGNSAYYNENEPLSGFTGTKIFSAPEMSKGQYGPKVDIWSVGVISYILLTGRYPWGNEGCLSKPEFFSSKELPWATISWGAKDLISKMLEMDVNKRLNATQVLKHPWINRHRR